MRHSFCLASFLAGLMVVSPAFAQPVMQPVMADRMMPVVQSRPAMQTSISEVVLQGKVIEVEKETVEEVPFKGSPAKQTYKIAVIKIADPMLGVAGLTQVRVGFLESAPALGGRPAGGFRPIGMALALSQGMEGVFFLQRHPVGDFYIIGPSVSPILSKDPNYAADLATVQKAVAAIDEPLVALKAKNKADRHLAAFALLNHYRSRPMIGRVEETPIPVEQSKLILEALSEMPWVPVGGDQNMPSRSQLWSLIQPEKFGFKPPMAKPLVPGAAPVDYAKQYEEATTAFLKENADKIRISKRVSGK